MISPSTRKNKKGGSAHQTMWVDEAILWQDPCHLNPLYGTTSYIEIKEKDPVLNLTTPIPIPEIASDTMGVASGGCEQALVYLATHIRDLPSFNLACSTFLSTIYRNMISE